MGTKVKASTKTGLILQKDDIVLPHNGYVAVDKRHSSSRNRI